MSCTHSLPARKSSLCIHGQSVDVVQEVANLFGKQRWRALGEVQFDAFQKQRFFSGKGAGSRSLILMNVNDSRILQKRDSFFTFIAQDFHDVT